MAVIFTLLIVLGAIYGASLLKVPYRDSKPTVTVLVKRSSDENKKIHHVTPMLTLR